MAPRIVLLTPLLLGVISFPVLGQQQNARCDTGSAREQDSAHPKRTHVMRVKDAEGKTHAVISPVRELKVARLIFVGAPSLPMSSQDEITQSITGRSYNDDEDGLNEVLERVRDGWQHHGYFKVEVEQSGAQTLSEDAETREVAITVNVQAGKRYRLNEIHFGDTAPSSPTHPSSFFVKADNSTPLTDHQLRALFPIQDAEIFDTHKIQQGLAELRKAYGARGYINFTALPTVTIDEANDRITLLIEFDQGKQFRYGKVEVTGMEPLLMKQRLQRAGLIPGNVFNSSHLEEFKEQNSSLLSNNFKTENDIERRIDEKTATVDLIIHSGGCDAP